MKKFPQEVYLHNFDDNQPEDEQCFVVEDRPEDFAEVSRKISAGRYRLVETVVVSAKTVVSVRKARR